jgi:hypothetical protein
MPKISSDAATIDAINMVEQAIDPVAPATGRWKHYFKSDGLYIIDDAGVVTGPLGVAGSGGDVATDALWDAAGDLVVGTGADAAVRVSVGADGEVLVADSGEAAGVKWAPMMRYITFGVNGTLVVGAGSVRFYAPFACTLVRVQAAVGAAPTGASVIVDVNKNGTTFFTTQANRPAVAAAVYVSSWATPDVTTLAVGDYVTVDVDQVGSSVAGSDLVVTVEATVP